MRTRSTWGFGLPDKSSAAPETGPRASALRTAIKLAVSLALLGVILWRLDLHAILEAIGRYHVQHVAFAAFVFLLATLIGVARWRLFVPEVAFVPLLRLSFIGQFYAMVLPGQVAGEAVKAYRLAKGQEQMARLAGSVLVDRVIGTLSMLAIGDLGYLLSSGVPHALGLSLLGLTAALGGALIALRIPAVCRLALRVPERLQRSRRRHASLAAPLASAIGVWRDYGMDLGRLASSLAMGLVMNGLAVAIYVILASDLGIHLPLVDWLWVTATVALAVLLPISVAGIGLREGALIACLGYLGVQGEGAVALSFGVFSVAALGALVGWLAEITQPAAKAG